MYKNISRFFILKRKRGIRVSVKNKVKRLNKEILNLQNKLETTELSNKKLKYKLNQEKQCKQYTEQLENIVKFAITNHIGNLKGGIHRKIWNR